MEARCIPAVVLGTDAFLSLARAQAAKLGLPHLAVALVGHPIGGIDPAIVRGKAETIVEPPGHKPPVTTKSRKATDGHSAD